MLPNTIFEIDENHAGIEVKKIYKEHLFPVEMLVTGRVFNGIEASFNKPHGKTHVMEVVVKVLLKAPKQYKSFVNNMLKKMTWPDLNDCLEILLIDGIVQIVFKNQRPRKGNYWSPSVVQLDPRVLAFFAEGEPDYNLETLALRELATQLLTHVADPVRATIMHYINEGAVISKQGVLIADLTSFEKFKSIILAVSYYFNLKENGKAVPLRHISNQIWGQPKLFTKYRNEIALSAGILPEELDAVLLPDINSSLHSSLIAISPIEVLKQQIYKLSTLLKIEGQQNLVQNILESINHGINFIVDSFEGSSNGNNVVLQKFLILYSSFEKKFSDGNSISEHVDTLSDLNQMLVTIKNHLLKIESIRLKFELIVLEEIGGGAFARVYKVFDPEYNKILACKVLFPRSYFKQVYGNDGDEYLLRFKREVRLLTQELQHENIVKVEKIHSESSPFWFTMPLANYTLDKWIKNNSNAFEEQRINIFKGILCGIEYLHERNKYHRDLAPKNILLFETDNGLEVKIADFGLAKDPESLSLLTAKSKRGYGHEEFTDPEQLNNLADSTNLSDIYSLGALLYYLLSGKSPKKRKYVRVRCQEVIMKAMDKRHRRYQSVYEFKEELTKFYNF
ncbi:serine/threonine-protein kinase [Paenibacillus polymyxa]|uniref:serine/threonine-protein kinase n=1 Tax=Paenibacillus polymyxa TaxID=1406 RepID=UPI00287F5C93|nr:serine/threonine-protein kinase [Paenibacillus polymyxa]